MKDTASATLKEPSYMRASESLIWPVESTLHWSDWPVGRKC